MLPVIKRGADLLRSWVSVFLCLVAWFTVNPLECRNVSHCSDCHEAPMQDNWMRQIYTLLRHEIDEELSPQGTPLISTKLLGTPGHTLRVWQYDKILMMRNVQTYARCLTQCVVIVGVSKSHQWDHSTTCQLISYDSLCTTIIVEILQVFMNQKHNWRRLAFYRCYPPVHFLPWDPTMCCTFVLVFSRNKFCYWTWKSKSCQTKLIIKRNRRRGESS